MAPLNSPFDDSLRPPLLSVALISAAAVGYEVLLLRLFSIIQWHHFAYMIISLALLGYGVSGTFLALAGEQVGRRFRDLLNPLELLWDPLQPLYLALLYLLLAVPFLFAANCIGLTLYRFRRLMGRTYGSDLLGAGTGALGMVGLLFWLAPVDALKALGAAGFAAAALSLVTSGGTRRWLARPLFLAAGLLPFLFTGPFTELKPSPYKGLSQALQVSGARIVGERSGPLGLLTVVESPRIPFRHAPGLSVLNPSEPPEQLGVFTDGGGFTVINRHDARGEAPRYLDFLTSALPYYLLRRPSVLVIGTGGGTDVLQAVFLQARRIDALEVNAQMAALIKEDYAAFSGRLYDRQDVRLHVAEARGFVSGGGLAYDLIQMALVDSFGAASAGLRALNESYLYTTEAMERYLARLNPGGLVSITRWLKLPPRDSLKLFATAVQALGRMGVAKPGRQRRLFPRHHAGRPQPLPPVGKAPIL